MGQSECVHPVAQCRLSLQLRHVTDQFVSRLHSKATAYMSRPQKHPQHLNTNYLGKEQDLTNPWIRAKQPQNKGRGNASAIYNYNNP